jgi:hypothetical protein
MDSGARHVSGSGGQTDAQRWERFLAYAARARAKPTFELEERDFKLQVAEGLRKVLELAREGAGWLEAVEQVFCSRFADRWYDLTAPNENEWLRGWASSDEESSSKALAQFLDLEQSAVDRFGSFARAVEEARSRGAIPPDPIPVLVFGSLFNFACQPESLPLVRAVLLNQLQQTLGYELRVGVPAVEQYEHHLGFSHAARERMQRAGIPVRDMLDVQSLLFIASEEEDFWASEPRAGFKSRSEKEMPYLAICAIYRDEAPYLAEWVEFHRLVGVERFFLYDNGSIDNSREVLAPYLEEGSVIIHDWPVYPGQIPAYDDCLRWHRFDSRWIAFIDVDEFLFSPTGGAVSEVLGDYECWPAVGVNWAVFGTGGHRTKPEGLVIESYLLRWNNDANRHIKSIVDPTLTIRAADPHHFFYCHCSAVDENHFPIQGPRSKSPSIQRLRVNHYVTRSEAEYRDKLARQRADTGWIRKQPRTFERIDGWYKDEAITAYVPAVREELARYERKAGAGRPASAIPDTGLKERRPPGPGR